MRTLIALLALIPALLHAQSFPRIGYQGALITNVVGAGQAGGGGGGSLAFGAEMGRVYSFDSTTTTALSLSAGASIGDAVAVIVSGRREDTPLSSLTDSKGNTYTIRAGATNGSAGSAFTLWVATAKLTSALTTSDTITVTWGSATATYRTVFAVNVTGAGASPHDISAQNSGYAASANVTATTTASDVLVGAVMTTSGSTYAPSWTQIGSTQTRTGDGAIITYQRTSASAGSQTMGGAFTPSENYCGVWVGIK